MDEGGGRETAQQAVGVLQVRHEDGLDLDGGSGGVTSGQILLIFCK